MAKAVDAYAKAVLALAREALVALAPHPKVTGAGVSVTRFWKAGAAAYAKVPELESLDLNVYRVKSTEDVRISVCQSTWWPPNMATTACAYSVSSVK